MHRHPATDRPRPWSTREPRRLIQFGAVWAWISYTWFAGCYDTDDVWVRLSVIAQMVGHLDPFHAFMIGVTIAAGALPVLLAAAGVPLIWCIAACTIGPWVMASSAWSSTDATTPSAC